MIFTYPWLLPLLGIPALLAVWEWQRPGHPLVVPFDHRRLRSGLGLKRFVAGLQISAPLLLAVAILLLAGPKRLVPSKDARILTNVVFCLDVSGSMLSPFGDGTRSDKALAAMTEFAQFRKGDAFGLSVFGSQVLHWVPVTKDLSAIAASAPFLRPERMPNYMGGTLIGHAVREVQKVLCVQPVGDRMIILISDGESYDLGGGVARQLAQELEANHITLFYIHVADGSPQEETYTLSTLSGGQAFSAGDPKALKEVFRRIDEMKPERLKPAAPVLVDFFWPFTAAGLACLGLQMAVTLGFRFTPW